MTIAAAFTGFLERWYKLKIAGRRKISRRQFFAVRQMVAVPADQGVVAGVFKKKLQRRRFDVAVAKNHVGAALMASVRSLGAFRIAKHIASPPQATSTILKKTIISYKPIAYRHHFTWAGNL